MGKSRWAELLHTDSRSTCHRQSISQPFRPQGSALFDQLQGASCHVPSQRTGNNQQAVAKVIKDQTIWPYTDLLLRGMGASLEEAIIVHAGEATTA
ncbi:MAG: di-heme oxidoredictase family protein [Cyanobacteriota bacterium]|nr:di-heme oxidoredictase family protein [Cyanobacteriota bacterium]